MNLTPRKELIPLLLTIAAAAGLACCCWIGLQYYRSVQQTPSLRLTAGPESTQRYRNAEYLRQQASLQNLGIELVPSDGSDEALEMLRTGKIDAAIVGSCIKPIESQKFTTLVVLNQEAVHILTRPGLTTGGPLRADLVGKRVNLGEVGSTEWRLGREFLSFGKSKKISEEEPGDVVTTEFGDAQILDWCDAIEKAHGEEQQRLIASLPDCFMLLDTLPCSLAQRLLDVARYEFQALPATPAFLLDPRSNGLQEDTKVERRFLEPTLIPAHSYYSSGVFPKDDCDTVGVRLLLVARSDLPAAKIQPLMKALYESEYANRMQPKSPMEIPGPYATNPVAAAYFHRDKPLVALQRVVDAFKQGMSIFGVFSAGALSLYGLIRKKKRRSSSDYLAGIRQIGETMQSLAAEGKDPRTSPETTKQLQVAMVRLRQELIDDVCSGRLKADQFFLNVLMLLNDVRQDLQLREREPTQFDLTSNRQGVPSHKAA